VRLFRIFYPGENELKLEYSVLIVDLTIPFVPVLSMYVDRLNVPTGPIRV